MYICTYVYMYIYIYILMYPRIIGAAPPRWIPEDRFKQFRNSQTSTSHDITSTCMYHKCAYTTKQTIKMK